MIDNIVDKKLIPLNVREGERKRERERERGGRKREREGG